MKESNIGGKYKDNGNDSNRTNDKPESIPKIKPSDNTKDKSKNVLNDLTVRMLDGWNKNSDYFELLKQVNSDLNKHDSISEVNETLNLEYIFNGNKMITYRFFNDRKINEKYIKFKKDRIKKPYRKKKERDFFEIDSYCKELKVGTEHDGRIYHYIICSPYINDEQELEESLANDRKKTAICIKKEIFMVRLPSELKSEDAMKLFLYGPKDIEGVSSQFFRVEDNDVVTVSTEEYVHMTEKTKKMVLSGYKLDKEPRYFHLCGLLNKNNINSHWFRDSLLNKYVKENFESIKNVDFNTLAKIEKSNKILLSKIGFDSRNLSKLKEITNKIVELTNNNDIIPYLNMTDQDLIDITGKSDRSHNAYLIRRCIEIDNRKLILKVVFLEAEDGSLRARTIVYPKINEKIINNFFKNEIFDDVNEAWEYNYKRFYNLLKEDKKNYYKVSSEEIINFLGVKSGIQTLHIVSRYSKKSERDIVLKIALNESAGGLQPTSICYLKEKSDIIKKEFNSEIYESTEEFYDSLYVNFFTELENNLYLTVYSEIGKKNLTLYHSTINSLKKRSKGDVKIKFARIKSNTNMQLTKIVFHKKKLNEIKKEFKNEIYDSKEEYNDIVCSNFYKALTGNLYLKSTSNKTFKILRVNGHGYAIERFKDFSNSSEGKIVVKMAEIETNSGKKLVTICFLKKKMPEIQKEFNNELFDSLDENLEWKFDLFKNVLRKSKKKYFTPFCNEVKTATRLENSSYINNIFSKYSKKSKEEIEKLEKSNNKKKLSKKAKDLIITKYSYVYSGKITTLNRICLFNKDLIEVKENLNINIFETREEAKIFKENNPDLMPNNKRTYFTVPPKRIIGFNFSERKEFNLTRVKIPEKFIGAKIHIENYEIDNNYIVIKLFKDFSKYKKNYIIDIERKKYDSPRLLAVIPKWRKIKIAKSEQKFLNTTYKSVTFDKYLINARILFNSDGTFTLFDDFKELKKGINVKILKR